MQMEQTRVLWSQFKQQESTLLFTWKGKTNPSCFISLEIIANPFGDYSLKFIFEYVAPPHSLGFTNCAKKFSNKCMWYFITMEQSDYKWL